MSNTTNKIRRRRCKICGQFNTFSAINCENPVCGIDLALYSEIVFVDSPEQPSDPTPPEPPKPPKPPKPQKEPTPKKEPKPPKQSEQSEQPDPPKPSKSKGWLIGLAAILAVALLLFALPSFGGDGNAQLRQPAVTEVPQSTTAAPAATQPVQTDPPATTQPAQTDPPATTQPAQTEPPTTAAPEPLVETMLAKDFQEKLEHLDQTYGWSDIKSITFLDTLAQAPKLNHDLSEGNTGAVRAWYDNGTLYIAAEGGVFAPVDCEDLFACDLMGRGIFSSLETIHFNDAFHTTYTTAMCYMFYNCQRLKSLDLRCFDTSNVICMDYMFYRCYNLISVDLSSFDTSHVQNMNSMFAGCPALEDLNLGIFDTTAVTEYEDFMDGDYLPNGRPWILLFTNLALQVTQNDITLSTPGETYTFEIISDLKNDQVTWTSADESIATVDKNGTVTYVGQGTTVITGTYYNQEVQCTVRCN